MLLEDILVLAPVSDVPAEADHVVLEEVQLTEAGLLVGLVEVALEGGEPLVLVVDQHSDKRVSSKQNTTLVLLLYTRQLLDPPFYALGPTYKYKV